MTLFVTFEGTEGSGKTTQIQLLARALAIAGIGSISTREPGGTPLGEAIRRILLDMDTQISAVAEAYLMTGARAEHLRSVIEPALARGQIVLCDRFYDSTFAYQGGGRGLPVDDLRALQKLAVADLRPDITFLLEIPVRTGLERRARERNTNRIDREDYEFHERVGNWYRSEASRDTARWVVIDGTRTPDVVHTAILANVMMRLGMESDDRDQQGSTST